MRNLIRTVLHPVADRDATSLPTPAGAGGPDLALFVRTPVRWASHQIHATSSLLAYAQGVRPSRSSRRPAGYGLAWRSAGKDAFELAPRGQRQPADHGRLSRPKQSPEIAPPPPDKLRVSAPPAWRPPPPSRDRACFIHAGQLLVSPSPGTAVAATARQVSGW